MPTTRPRQIRGHGAELPAESQGQQPLLILAALVTIYIVLGMLYESLIHPLTVLSTLPAAGVGAVLALMMFGMDFSIIALIGVFLLLGIVKKNAILIIDFAIHAAARARPDRRAGGARGEPAALPPDPDDDAGGGARRAAAGDRLRRGRGAAPAARRRDHRRADRQPVADAHHDARRLCLPRRSGAPPPPPDAGRRRPRCNELPA